MTKPKPKAKPRMRTKPSGLSVVIPTYHTQADLLEKSIRSVVEQKPAPEFVFVIEDGVQPEVPALVRSFKNPRVILIRLPNNVGPLMARRIGIEATKTPFIAFQDADDESLPGRFAAQLDYLQKHPRCAVVSVITVDNKGGKLCGPCTRQHMFENGNSLHGGHCMFRREAYDDCGGIDAFGEWIPGGEKLFLGEDYALWLQMIAAGWEIGRVEEVLYRRHRHDRSLTARFTRECDDIGVRLRGLIQAKVSYRGGDHFDTQPESGLR